MKKIITLFLISFLTLSIDSDATVILNSATDGGFETGATFGANGWAAVNGASNNWYCGTFTRCNGARGAYIGTGAANNNYANNLSVNHFYRDFTVPAGETVITLTFNWHAQGDPGVDFLRVYVAPTTFTPVAGTQNNIGDNISGIMTGTTGCNSISFTLNPAFAGTTQRLIFQWRNNASNPNNSPAAMIDDVSIVSTLPPVPGCSILTSPANASVGVCNGGSNLTWAAPTTGGTPTGYLLYFGTNTLPTNIVNGVNVGNVLTYNLGSLAINTTFYWYVVPTNSGGNAVGCSGTVFSFTTGSGCFLQSAAGSYTTCGGTFYDSGYTSNYSDNENNTTTICSSIAGQYISASFNTFNLESCCDNLTIYNGNSTAAPLIGTFTGTSAPCNTVSTAANGCLTFSFISDGSITYSGWDATLTCVAAPPPAPAGTLCSNAASIALPYTATGQTTACYGNDYTNASIGSCGTLYESGEDHVYSLTVASPQCLAISLTNCSSGNIGYQVYSGCPGSVGTTCIGNNGGANPLSGSVTLPAAGTYFIVVDSWSTPSNVTYDISVVSNGTGPANDLSCSSTALALNTNLTGDNSCSGSTSEPASPACWTGGTLNTVWYSVVCPASGQLTIRTTIGTLSNTQIALYSGTCGTLTLVACNDNAPACGTSTYNNSQITSVGLVAGATYFIRVDGTSNLTGTFDIMAVDGTVGFTAAAGQDCAFANPVCNQTIAIGNPGYQAYGNVCDYPGTGICLASGERGSAWSTIPINAAGNLEFDIVPNDYTGGSGCCSTDYDFAIWKVSGAGSTTCAGIAAGAIPIACNYSGLGVTGCFSAANGTSPAIYPGYGAAYMARIPVVAGEVYELVISNFSNSTSGFTLNFTAASPVNYTAAGSSITWTGGTNTSWTLPSNWGGCAIPTCGIDATITPSSTNQPVLPTGNYYVNNLTISAGATLTLQSGANLHVCGNFTNSGSLLANAGSTISFDNAAATQNISGSLVGTDKVGNLVITKTGGSVIFNNNIDIGGSFTTSNGTSIANFNSKYVRVAGNFSNNNGATTVTNIGTGTLEFNGTGAQIYNQGASLLTLNNVLMAHTGTGVTCATNMVLGTSGILTLTAGKIITAAFEVQVRNTASAACTAGNTTSFVQGNLRRYLNAAATSYDFPVGHSTQGYQSANITFTTATTIPQLVAKFDPWAPIVNGPAASECPTNTYNALNALNNGYWTITASANPTSGTYNTSLYSTTYTNSGGAAGWTVMKAATIAGPWALSGTCVTTSTPPLTQRTGMTNFSVFAVAQSVQPLPVSIVDFSGSAGADFNHLQWTTASENQNDYFSLERSTDGVTFTELGRIDGAGNSTQLLNYSFNDMNPAEGINYYRLKQTDFNGDFTYSAVIDLNFHRGNMSVNNIRPNPTNGEVNFDFASPEETEIHFIITDVTGRIVADERRKVKPGVTSVGTLIAGEAAGIYSLKVIEEIHGYIWVSRIVKY
ncbi:MAG: hypothetical protein M3R17_15190 [Bacteroidota bacterium]|nr:hypothetical protein [Bacteroidota bacterium]